MNSNTLTGKVANFSARRRWTVLGAWLVVLIAAFMLAGTIGEVTTSENGPGDSKLESDIARALVAERISTDENSKEYVIVEFESGTVPRLKRPIFPSFIKSPGPEGYR